MSIKVITPGLSTSVQDLGRPGYYHLGIPLSGGMDRYALRVSNLLVGNDEGAAVLETAFMGPELLFNKDAIVAVTGAGMLPKVDGEAKSTWASFVIKAGQTLSFDFLTSGARAYIAVSGGIDVPIILGSRSTYTLGALGGFEGRGLAAQDELPINESDISKHTEKSIDESLRNLPQKPGELRFIPGIYWHRITEKSQATFINDTWKVAPEADRIGYRFKGGEALDFVDREQAFGAGSDPSNIVDSCYPYGSIQVPSGSEPIVLHRDAVSGGGYFMVGVVISADMDLIGQLQPNKPSTFVPVTMEEALIARRERKEKLSKVRDFLS
ncbi:biotin-dependent carboxyltransferase family protein [Cocleimonas sp. KMM 6892]|uniref:5-oxoprolinase subunit C family protein n=1 Tax=unclassified Cocleimonas TaxID=2639732 RepID=UPI002DC042CF|nr:MULTISPECIES: biotin-dependent carboxyltransferase family protein [unclassified Cocleimonas]MEB8433355.1 biotin-dependent carboxyltransferase family protein [Cocleimonas sp. KMM 6892]MEC4716166.1 biotin-dependent carboxyltransferase family protein [Cocleimonas sp. KMM 6895]MEC4745941.1 biotin-dependent carboxyltransferase family protein [Cocleimonas sp. KMM 6896]